MYITTTLPCLGSLLLETLPWSFWGVSCSRDSCLRRNSRASRESFEVFSPRKLDPLSLTLFPGNLEGRIKPMISCASWTYFNVSAWIPVTLRLQDHERFWGRGVRQNGAFSNACWYRLTIFPRIFCLFQNFSFENSRALNNFYLAGASMYCVRLQCDGHRARFQRIFQKSCFDTNVQNSQESCRFWSRIGISTDGWLSRITLCVSGGRLRRSRFFCSRSRCTHNG